MIAKLVPFAATILLSGLLTVADAQEGQVLGQHPSDAFFTRAGLEQALSGHVLEFRDGSQLRFRRDGRYLQSASDGRTVGAGWWTIRDRGLVCVRFDDGSASCDTYVRSARQVVRILASGDRYPVRSAVRE